MLIDNLTLDKEKIKDNTAKLLDLQSVRKNLDFLNKEIIILRDDLEKEEVRFENRKFHYNKNIPYLEKIKKEYKEIKEEIVDIKIKIEKCEEKKKKIKTIKEFKALNKEIDNLNQENGLKENTLLDKSEDLEYKEEKMKKIAEGLKEIEESLKEKQKELSKVVKERQNEIRKESSKREKIESGLDGSLVKLFNRIYSNNGKTALASIENGSCNGCNVLLPKQVGVNVKKMEELILCPSCSRILYFEELIIDN